MSIHDYSPEQALETILQKVRDRDTILADRIQVAIDAGKDINETETGQGRKHKPRTYRRKMAYSHEEALEVAIDVLQAHFVELPMFINSAVTNFEEAALDAPGAVNTSKAKNEPDEVRTQGNRDPKRIDIEVRTETQLSHSEQATLSLERISQIQIDEQKSKLLLLRKLVKFQET